MCKPLYSKMLGTFPNPVYQAATSQRYFPKWKLSNCAISQAESCGLGNFHFGNLHLGSRP